MDAAAAVEDAVVGAKLEVGATGRSPGAVFGVDAVTAVAVAAEYKPSGVWPGDCM